MKILIAYNSSPAAQAMLGNLANVGIPEHSEVLVLSVNHSAEDAAARLARDFPSWTITEESTAGPAVETVIRRANEWQADLIALGSRQRTALERLTEGSVSMRIANEAECSVRICRQPPTAPNDHLHILIGYDGRPGADAAVRAAAARHWPPSTNVRLLTAVGFGDSPLAELFAHEDYAEIRQAQAEAVRILSQREWLVTTEVVEADPKVEIVDHAAKFEMDAIFIGNNDRRFLHRLILGTVSSAIVPAASCAVEIVR